MAAQVDLRIVRIRQAEEKDLDGWVELRAVLSPGNSMETLRAGAEAILASPDRACFLLMDPSGAPAGFAEVALFRGAVGPYAKEIEAHSGGYAAFAHLEGWYVKPAYRGHGFGRKLVERVEAWCRSRSVRVLASDTTPLHPDGCDAHVRAGFTKIHEITIFMKSL